MKWVVFSFIGFALFIGTLVTICVRQDVSLVSANYYQDELGHQAKMTKQQNMADLKSEPSLILSQQHIKVSYPALNALEHGEIRLTRPSDSRLDQRFTLSKDTEQDFALEVSEKGLYRVTMQWSMNGKDYYFEKLMVL
ncbi:MAG: FixH family protein [Bacteroidetes bacterium]|nr:FixH family protein [Bacteroidota bacterium]